MTDSRGETNGQDLLDAGFWQGTFSGGASALALADSRRPIVKLASTEAWKAIRCRSRHFDLSRPAWLNTLEAVMHAYERGTSLSASDPAVAAMRESIEKWVAKRGEARPDALLDGLSAQQISEATAAALQRFAVDRAHRDLPARFSLVLFRSSQAKYWHESYRIEWGKWCDTIETASGMDEDHLVLVPPPSCEGGIEALAEQLGIVDRLPCVAFLGHLPRIRGHLVPVAWRTFAIENRPFPLSQLEAIYSKPVAKAGSPLSLAVRRVCALPAHTLRRLVLRATGNPHQDRLDYDRHLDAQRAAQGICPWEDTSGVVAHDVIDAMTLHAIEARVYSNDVSRRSTSREMILAHLPPDVAAWLEGKDSPAAQLHSDLCTLNRCEPVQASAALTAWLDRVARCLEDAALPEWVWFELWKRYVDQTCGTDDEAFRGHAAE